MSAAEALTLTDANTLAAALEVCEDCGRSPDLDAEAVAGIVRRWHDEVHAGAFQNCDEQPCDAITRLTEAWV